MNVGDVGVALTATIMRDGVALDISTATTIQFLVRHSTGTTKTFTGALVGGGTGGVCRYTTIASTDIDVAGQWFMQVRIVMPAADFKTSQVAFQVGANL